MKPTQYRIHIAGQPRSIEINTDAATFLADGRTITRFDLVVRDTFGVAIPSSYIITVKSDTGTIVSPDIDPNQDGIQRKIENGKVSIDLQSPAQAAVATITASWGNAKVEKQIEFNTPVEPLMLVGSANGTINSLSTGGNMSDSAFSSLKNENSISDGIHTDGRLAFYGRGSIWSNYLLTASYRQPEDPAGPPLQGPRSGHSLFGLRRQQQRGLYRTDKQPALRENRTQSFLPHVRRF